MTIFLLFCIEAHCICNNPQDIYNICTEERHLKNIDQSMQAWKNWSNGTSLKLLDSSLRDSYSINEVIRCIHIGLLCVQENPADRPTMASINLMLSSDTITLSSPQKPAFFRHIGIEPNMP
jgi:hypothetical protein